MHKSILPFCAGILAGAALLWGILVLFHALRAPDPAMPEALEGALVSCARLTYDCVNTSELPSDSLPPGIVCRDNENLTGTAGGSSINAGYLILQSEKAWQQLLARIQALDNAVMAQCRSSLVESYDVYWNRNANWNRSFSDDSASFDGDFFQSHDLLVLDASMPEGYMCGSFALTEYSLSSDTVTAVVTMETHAIGSSATRSGALYLIPVDKDNKLSSVHFSAGFLYTGDAGQHSLGVPDCG